MTQRNIVILIICSCLYGCSDYKTGYKEGYAGSDKNRWIAFGRERYLEGYHSGQAEKFQEDWVAEEPIATSLFECPTIFVRTDPLNVLPPEYERIAQDIYRIAE